MSEDVRRSLLDHYSSQTAAHGTYLLTYALIGVTVFTVGLQPCARILALSGLLAMAVMTIWRTAFWGGLANAIMRLDVDGKTMIALQDEAIKKIHKCVNFFGSYFTWWRILLIPIYGLTFALVMLCVQGWIFPSSMGYCEPPFAPNGFVGCQVRTANPFTVLFWGALSVCLLSITLGDLRWWKRMEKSDAKELFEKDEGYYKFIWEVGKRSFYSGLVGLVLALIAAVFALLGALFG
jgi:hypothetical protein